MMKTILTWIKKLFGPSECGPKDHRYKDSDILNEHSDPACVYCGMKYSAIKNKTPERYQIREQVTQSGSQFYIYEWDDSNHHYTPRFYLGNYATLEIAREFLTRHIEEQEKRRVLETIIHPAK